MGIQKKVFGMPHVLGLLLGINSKQINDILSYLAYFSSQIVLLRTGGSPCRCRCRCPRQGSTGLRLFVYVYAVSA